ncbi:MAG: adenylate/guanylate cyclase domain-containing protein [Myxococcales bacterium]|nr:adenylate/guanylate cyclase domain-containing protein [Myxococcales bacterium]
MKRYQAELERIIGAPRDLVWAVVSDTNRSDRALGLAPATYRWDVDEEGKRVRVASASELGQALEWIEPPYQWIEGRVVQGRRRFVKGPVSRAGFEARLDDAPGGKTRLTAMAWMETGGVIGFFGGPVQRLKFRRGLDRYLGAIERLFDGVDTTGLVDPDQPAAVRVKHVLGGSGDAVTTGPRTEPNRALLERRAQALHAVVDPEVAKRIVTHLAERPDEEVQQMRPFELAGQWGLDRRAVLRGFLHATVAGLCDLRWQVNCPVCRVGASVVEGLSSVGESTHCDACEIDFGTDFGQHVEAVFPSNPAIRSVTTALYCASSPAFLPHVLAQLEVAPGEAREEAMEVPLGSLHARALKRPGGAHLDVERPPAVLAVTVTENGVTCAAEGEADGPTTLRLVNETDGAVSVLLERAGWSADAVLGSVVASFPDFLDLFATEAPASGADLQIGRLALLFSDLVGSTALYERVGDARAFAIVEEHFRLMGRAVDANQGAIVKTMGDAVMASFPSLAEAVAAARQMIEDHDAAHADDGLGVKIGVHAGPCLAVRANDRLDFFGTTVNMAARLQAKAEASEIVLTEEAWSYPEIAAVVGDFPVRRFEADLKGIEERQKLVGVQLAGETSG